LGNARLVTGLAAVAIAALSLGAGRISPWWLLLPLVVFVAQAIVHDRIDRQRAAAARGVAYWERATGRIADRWIGVGSQGERFRDPKHVYAEDLDLFGRGSLFELFSTCRTAAGEAALAGWLLAPGDRAEVLARQEAVEELRPRIDLREELAIMGEDIRAAVDAKPLGDWGVQPAVRFFTGARFVAPPLAVAAVVTLVLFFVHVLPLSVFLVVVLLEIAYSLAIRDAVGRVVAAVMTPARELGLMRLLLERLERETFTSPRLVALREKLKSAKGAARTSEPHEELIAPRSVLRGFRMSDGKPASRRIRSLKRTIEFLDSARNQFFRPVAAMLLWVSQFAMAVEAWRIVNGPRIGEWTKAIGEFEALCSLACFAYEHPAARFPELLADPAPKFDAAALHHPLIPAAISVANDVQLGEDTRLWIVSGSNMSGKSTLLRAVGLSAVLAWAGAPVMCSRLRVSRLYIGASMRTNDSLVDHRSRFYAEIERLREIVELTRVGHPTMFLLDELLSGTNSHDRRIGAQALVRGLVEHGAIGLLTTHDLALAEIAATLNGRATNVHFEDHIENGEILFDYHLRPGIVTRSNALELMRAVGLDV
jgi:hypothetical protein